LVVLALGAFVVGLLVANASGRAERQLVSEYVGAWSHDNYARMYSLLDPGSRQHLSEAQFTARYQSDARTGTLTSVVPVRVGSPQSNVIAVSVRARTRLFGTLQETVLVPLVSSSSGPSIRFNGALLFPGLRPGERLTRLAALAPRATLLARDGTPLAQGPGRTSPIPGVASQIVGVLGPIPGAEAPVYQAEGYPPSAKVGHDGLERVFERQLAGTPGATLLAGKRLLAAAAPIPGTTVKTTIDPAVESAAISALAGRYGGIVAMDPRNGHLLALAGVAFSALQPPGSTMKIITSTAALQAGLVKLGDSFPISTSATIEGYTLQNANGEACGGTFLNAFAVSCNSVFAPLGVKVGAQRLVAMAQRFGFNQPPTISGAAESQIPSASTIGDNLAVGSSAIGQGRVLASTLEMTDVAATIAMGGQRPIPTLLDSQSPSFVPVTSSAVAALVQRMMVAVVSIGTGTAAAIPGVQVAGKTGTAELANTAITNNTNTTTTGTNPANTAKETDAWFVGYAPVAHPRIVAGALFPAQGAGGATAAPAARAVLLAGLQSR
jgi:cell division protein FtsI/penicillin-binding protein 2